VKTKPGITCCPHCGGRNGFVTDIVFKATRTASWDNADLDTEDYTVVREMNPRCNDCGEAVRSLMEPQL
jgi:hypothetical protein